MKQGWIKIHRKLLECDIWDYDEPYTRRDAWIELLLLANHSDKDIIFDGHKTVVKRGQYLTSVRKLATRWQWGKDKTLSFLRLLEECGMIIKESDSRRTLLTIVNYEVYQAKDDDDQTVTRQLTDSEQTVSRHSPATNKNVKNEKNEKNEKNDKNNTPYNPPRYYPNDETLDKAFADYVAMRKQLKKPMGERAITLAKNELQRLAGSDNDLAVKIIEQSILKSWLSFYPLKEDYKPNNTDLAKKWGITP